jgi:chromate transporter
MRQRNGAGPPTPAGLPPTTAIGGGGGSNQSQDRRISTLELGRIFLEVGATSFGGLGPSLAIIERELVEKRGVLTASDVAEATAATRLLPGSALIQMMSFLGYRLRGWTGAAVAVMACVVPPVTAMLALAVFYDALSGWPVFGRVARSLTAAVVGLLLASACRYGRATLGGPAGLGIALAAFGAAAALGIPAAAVVLAGGMIGVPLLGAPGAGQPRGSEKGGGS